MLRTKLLAVGLVLAAVGFSGIATAQDAPRFQMERANGGFMVMDAQTGNTFFCSEQGGKFVCDTIADREASDNSVEVLQKKITELEARVEALESGQSSVQNLPSEAEFEQTLNFMERFFRRFIGIVKGLENDTPTNEQPPAAGRTPSEQL